MSRQLTLCEFPNCVFGQSVACTYCMGIYMAVHRYGSCNETWNKIHHCDCSKRMWNTVLPDVNLKLSGTLESLMAFIACLRHLNLGLRSTFLTFFGQFFLVSIPMRTACERNLGKCIQMRNRNIIGFEPTFSISLSICQRVRWSSSWMFPDFRCLFHCLAPQSLCPEFPSTNAIVGRSFRTVVWSDRRRRADRCNCYRWRAANHHFCTPENQWIDLFKSHFVQFRAESWVTYFYFCTQHHHFCWHHGELCVEYWCQNTLLQANATDFIDIYVVIHFWCAI